MSTINDLIIEVHPRAEDQYTYGIWVETNGFEENKETLLFLHGYMSNNEVYDPLMEKYADDYNVISMDLRGHGNSETPDTEAWRVEDFANDVYQVIDSIIPEDHKVNIIASSLSTAIALQFTIMYPNLVGKLFLVSPTYKFTKTFRARIMQNFGLHTPKPIVDSIFEVFNFMVPLFVMNGDKKEKLKATFENMKRLEIVTHRKILGQTVQNWIINPSLISQKTLIIAGEADWVVPYEDSKELNNSLEKSTLITIPKFKHFILQNKFDFITEVLEMWLKKDYKLLRFKEHLDESIDYL